ncbi:MAG: HAMP domain-containing histidine kinase [Gemmatimonadales bacterium]|nr:HAMP domain-containing histidine kinase [Gemmatimonadales bacterium]
MPKDPARIAPESSQFVSAASLRVRLDWFNKLRWVAAAGALIAIFLAYVVASYSLPLTPLLTMVLVLVGLNTGYVLRNYWTPPQDISEEIKVVKLQMFGDLLVLTALISLTGGVENPLHFLYVIHVIIASLLFKGGEIFQIAWLAIILFTAEALGEYLGWLPHFHSPSVSEAAHELPYLLVTLASFWLVLLFSAYIGSRIMRHNRTIKDELVARQMELVVADKAKMDFFRFVTHEVKSPISTAQSAVETALELGGSRMNDSVEDMLSRAVGRLEQATGMVRDLADLTRGGVVKQEHLRTIDLSAVLARIVANHEDIASRRGQRIRLEIPEDGLELTTIRSMIEKVISNLISNAVRYNKDEGMVSVRLKDLGKRVRLEVEDEGIGIAADDTERIFDEFYRSQEAIEMTNLGTGLGLPIVKKFVTDLEGFLSLQSTLGQGTKFTVTLPKHGIGRERKAAK